MTNITCVSGYWQITNKHNNKYLEWFNNSLKVNCPYVFFSNKQGIELIKKYRGVLPTHYIECEIADFYTWKYREKMITHPKHCPSIELNLIWNEKIFLLQKAIELNPFNSEWFHWIDAGVCVYRDIPPKNIIMPNINLPTNKFIYSSSNPYYEQHVNKTTYYHHISGTYLVHSTMIDKIAELYKIYLDKLVDKNNIWTDQVILTHIFKDHHHLFLCVCNGYGEISRILFG
jgi:hypothetical protein